MLTYIRPSSSGRETGKKRNRITTAAYRDTHVQNKLAVVMVESRSLSTAVETREMRAALSFSLSPYLLFRGLNEGVSTILYQTMCTRIHNTARPSPLM